jgi:hypothetical protein
LTIRDVPCPRCGNLMSKHELGSHFYYYCLKFDDVGCDTIYADDPDCYFGQIYIITPQGELIGYKGNGGEVIKTKVFLPEFWGRKPY